MATQLHNLSDYDPNIIPNASGMRFGIVVSEWNAAITEQLKEDAYSTLIKHGAKPEDIITAYVPGSMELVYGAKRMLESKRPQAIIVLGCVIKGETPHFDYVCSGVTQGISRLNADGDIPFIFGLLTTNTMEQALARAGGELGSKGVEAAVTAIKMVQFTCALK